MTTGVVSKAQTRERTKGIAALIVLLLVVALPGVAVHSAGAGGGTAPASADLQISDPRIVARSDPTDLFLSLRVDNKGDGAAENVTIDFWFDGTFAGRIEQDFWFGAGSTTWMGIDWPFTDGGHTIRAVVDPDGVIQETNEDNNELIYEVPVDTPEVYVDRVWDPEDLDADGRTEARFFVYSVGTAPMPPSAIVIRLDGAGYALAGTPELPVGTATEFRIPFHAEPGSYMMEIHIDPMNEVPELEETYNRWVMPVKIGPDPVPDLVAALEVPELDGRYYGDTASATATVRNAGDASSDPSRATVTLDGEILSELDLPPIEPNGTHSFQVDVPLRPGADRLELVVDPMGGPEAEPADNRAEVRLDLGTPDLKAVRLDVEEEVPEEGVPVDLTVAFAYNGSLTLPGAQATLWIDDRIMATWSLDEVGAKETHTFGYTWHGKEGDHVLRFEVDTARGVEEPDRGDNHLERNVTVRAETPATCRDAGSVSGSTDLRESCRRILLGEDEPLQPFL